MSRGVQLVLVAIVLEVVLLVGGHGLLLSWFAEGEVARVLFTGGHAVSGSMLLGAGLFFLFRLTLYLILPGVVLTQLAWLARSVLRSSATGDRSLADR